MSRSKLAQFEELLSVRDYPQILSRMVKLNLPYGQEVLAEPFRAEQLVWGTLGDFVRELLGKDAVSYTHLDVYKRQKYQWIGKECVEFEEPDELYREHILSKMRELPFYVEWN